MSSFKVNDITNAGGDADEHISKRPPRLANMVFHVVLKHKRENKNSLFGNLKTASSFLGDEARPPSHSLVKM